MGLMSALRSPSARCPALAALTRGAVRSLLAVLLSPRRPRRSPRPGLAQPGGVDGPRGRRGSDRDRRPAPAGGRRHRPAHRHRQRRDHRGARPGCSPTGWSSIATPARRWRRARWSSTTARTGWSASASTTTSRPAPASSTTADALRRALLPSQRRADGPRRRERLRGRRRGVFTTCEGDDPPWSFRFGSGTADLDDIVYGRDASFWVKDIPLIPWLPFFAAAIRRERQSGFLFPEVGQSPAARASSREVPYFWAIDDSQDLTVVAGHLHRARGRDRGRVPLHPVPAAARRADRLLRPRGPPTIHDCTRPRRRHFQATTGRSRPGSLSRWTPTSSPTTRCSASTATGCRSALEPARRDQRLRHQALGHLEPRRQYALVPGPHHSTGRWSCSGVPEISSTGMRQPIPGMPGFFYETDRELHELHPRGGLQRRCAPICHPRVLSDPGGRHTSR